MGGASGPAAAVPMRPLPVAPKPYFAETPASFFFRLCDANAIDLTDLWLSMRRVRPDLPLGVLPQYALPMVEALGGLPIGHFSKWRGELVPHGRRARSTKGHVQPRSVLCRRCTRGEIVEVARHTGPVCVRHRRWHDGKIDVDLDGHTSMLAAQRTLNGGLSERGIAYRSTEGLVVRELVHVWHRVQTPLIAPGTEIEEFPAITRLIHRLSGPEMIGLLMHTKAGHQAQAAALELAFDIELGLVVGATQTVGVKDREVILSGTAIRANGRTIPLGLFGAYLLPRIPTIRARLLRHQNAW